MNKILIYENDNVNEYEILFDQEYMNVCLKNYKRTFSLLKSGCCLFDSSVSFKDIVNITGRVDSFILSNVKSIKDSDNYIYRYIASINPTVYNILNENGNFALDSKRIHALYSWYLAIKDNPIEGQRCLSLPSCDYYNLDEKINLRDNICELLSGVSLACVGKVDTKEPLELVSARRNAMFVEEFNLEKIHVQVKKK